MNKIIDLSHRIENEMPVFTGDRKVLLEQTNFININGNSNFRLDSELHIGTHIDSPAHFVFNSKNISEITLNNFISKAIIINAENKKIIERKDIENYNIPKDSIVVIYTEHYKKWGKKEYFENYPILSEDLAWYLVEKKIKMLCLDTPSPDTEPYYVHKILLKNEILIAENLTNTSKLLNIKDFTIYAIPLNICSCGSPARIFAMY